MDNEQMPISMAREIALKAVLDGAKAERERIMSPVLQIRNIAYANKQEAVVMAMDTLISILSAGDSIKLPND